MNENVAKFFELYDADPALRERCENAEALYPGSLEVRSAVVEEVLLPIAKELGLEFTVADLRAYETKRKIRQGNQSLDEPLDEYRFWLLEYGWDNDGVQFGDEKY